MLSKKRKGKRRIIDDAFKHKVCMEYLNSDLSKIEIQQKYNIGGNSRLLEWLRKFGFKETNKIYIPPVTMPKPKRIKELKDKEKTLHFLEKKVRELEAKNEALEQMIQLAEERFKIRIRKK